MKMKFCLLLIPIIFLIAEIHQIKTENKKLPQKSFDEIFGEKWEEKERNEQKKREIIAKYNKIKEKIKQKGRKYSKKERHKIEQKIAKKLGSNRSYIQKWIKEFGLYKNKPKTDEEKIEIVQKFMEMKNELKQKGRKYSTKEWKQNYVEICKKIGISYRTIARWIKQFGICNKRITEKEKMEKMKKYWEIKRENPAISDKEISKTLKIDRSTIFRWEKQFGEEISEEEQ